MTVYTTNSLTTAYSNFLNALPGDIVQLQPGEYDNVGRKNLTKNTAGLVTFKSQIPGAAIIMGDPIDLGTQFTRFEGFDLQYEANSAAITFVNVNGDNCEIIRNRCHFKNLGPTTGQEHRWFQSKRNNCLFAYNECYNKGTEDAFFVASRSSTQAITGTKVLHNWFHDFIQDPADTKSESLRIGESSMAMMDFDGEVAYNRFDNINADTEIMSIKSSGNNIHHNWFDAVSGSIVLRQAHDCQVKYNVFKGGGGKGGGIRAYGHGHVIEHNQMLDNPELGSVNASLFMGSGDREEYPTTDGGSTPAVPGQVIELNAHYARFKNNTIRYNIFSNGNAETSAGNAMIMLGNDAGLLYQPEDNTFEENILMASSATMTDAISGTNPASWAAQTSLQKNYVHATGTASIGDIPSSAYTSIDLQLQRHPDGTYRCVFQLTPKYVGIEAD